VTRVPTISVVISAFNAERWIDETLESALAQTRPPREVIVIDDGSTDGTARRLERFAERVRVFSQANRGVAASFNRAFAEASGDYVALCGADDIWEPSKLEWQAEAIAAHPEIDVAFGHARMFGIVEGDFVRPPGSGILDGAVLARRLYDANLIAAPSAVIRRALHTRLGGFREDFPAEDYEFWLRALRAGAVFYYDPRLLLHYRRHGENMSMPGAARDDRLLPQLEMNYAVHRLYADLVTPAELSRMLAKDLCDLGRHLVDLGRPTEARRMLRASMRRHPEVRALAWLVLLRLSPGRRRRVVARIVGMQGAIGRLQGVATGIRHTSPWRTAPANREETWSR
jgi:glycosyltransferase involved in cell wall biosynthesis